MARVKIGRRASQAERDHVKWVVALYREAKAAGGRLTLNAGEPEETVFCADAEFLLQELDNFAQDGTFLFDIDTKPIYAKFLAKNAGPRYEDKVLAVAEKMHVSERTAARYISPSGGVRQRKQSAPK